MMLSFSPFRLRPPRFAWYRDGFAGALAILIALVFGYAIYKTYEVLDDENVFARAKDLVAVVADAARSLLQQSRLDESTRSFDPDRLRNAIARAGRR
jgi:hypothetical protein